MARHRKTLSDDQERLLQLVTNLKNHPGYWLNPGAAASLERLEAAHGRVPINSAGRTEGQQQTLIDRFDRGGAANRPPNLFNPARPARASRHVIDGGLAIDTSAIAHMLKYGPEFGWYQNFAYDPVHFEYDPTRDKHRGGKPTTGNQNVKVQQNFLNVARGEKLAVDGIAGDSTKSAVKRYQTFLRKGYGYKGALDGVWGPSTQAAHSTYYAAWSQARNPSSSGGDSTVKGEQLFLVQARGEKIAVDGNKGPQTTSAIKRYQQFLRRYGYTGAVDGNWGTGTQKAHSKYYAEWKKSR